MEKDARHENIKDCIMYVSRTGGSSWNCGGLEVRRN